MIRLVEAFLSLQGESTHAGRRCIFLRFAGCNLACNYCDTLYAHDPKSGEAKSIDELLALARAFPCRLLEITGGEPLINPETPELCSRLLESGFEVMLETNGSLPIDAVPIEVRKILDCKLPDSGMAERNCFENYKLLQKHDEVKFVVSSRWDFDFALKVINQYSLPEKTSNLLFSPVWGRVEFPELAQWIIDAEAPGRMQLQLHKLIWGEKPGV